MQTMLVPHAVEASSARMWIGVTGASVPRALRGDRLPRGAGGRLSSRLPVRAGTLSREARRRPGPAAEDVRSQARRDLLPSFWSHAAIVPPAAKTLLYETSLEPAGGKFEIPLRHGIQTGRTMAYDDPAAFPNIAAIQWRLKPGSLGQDAAGRDETFASALDRVIERLRSDRGTIDLPSALWAWLGFAWGVGDQTNPLLRGVGIPSALLHGDGLFHDGHRALARAGQPVDLS